VAREAQESFSTPVPEQSGDCHGSTRAEERLPDLHPFKWGAARQPTRFCRVPTRQGSARHSSGGTIKREARRHVLNSTKTHGIVVAWPRPPGKEATRRCTRRQRACPQPPCTEAARTTPTAAADRPSRPMTRGLQNYPL
jgi:hypothetical protein